MTATSPTVIHIRQGATPADSIDHASCLLRGIRVLAEQGVDQDGMDADTCYLVGATVDTLIALLAAIDVPVSRAA